MTKQKGDYVYFYTERGRRVGKIISISTDGHTAWLQDPITRRYYQRPVRNLQTAKGSHEDEK
jgi:hypothetical protein